MPAVETMTFAGLADTLQKQGADLRKLNLGPTMKVGARITKSDLQQRFNLAQSPDNASWKPLAHKRPRGGNKPLLDTGRTRASLAETVGKSEFTIGTNAPGANLHQRGGIVRPKKGKYLAIPVTRQAQLAGSPRRFAGKLSMKFGKKGGVMFTVQKSFGEIIQEAIGGTTRKRRKQKETVHFILVLQVTVPARPFMGFALVVQDKIGRLVMDAAHKPLLGR